MGKLVAGINGPFVGKVGHTIGSSWRGIPYIKSLGRRRKPVTEGEKINRYIFGMTQQWLYPLTPFLRVGFKNYTPTNQGVNAAKSFLYKNALVKDGFDSSIDPTLVKVSHGELPLPARMDVELRDGYTLEFSWDTDCERINELDQVMLLAYDIEHSEVNLTTHGQFRKAGRDELDVGHLSNFVVYAAFLSADRMSQSDSVYLGSFTAHEFTGKRETKAHNKKGQEKNTAENNAEVAARSADSVAAASDQASTYNADIEYVPENQLNLFESLEEAVEIRSAEDTDHQETQSLAEAETEQETQAITEMETIPIAHAAQETQSLPESENKEPVRQQFTYINPKVEIEKKNSKSADIGPEEPDEQVIIKRDRITYITSKKHLDRNKDQKLF